MYINDKFSLGTLIACKPFHKHKIERDCLQMAIDILCGLQENKKAQIEIDGELENIFIEIDEKIYVRIWLDVEANDFGILIYRTEKRMQGMRSTDIEDFTISKFWREIVLVRKNDPNHDTTKFYNDVYDV